MMVMERFAVFGDTHSGLAALKSILDDSDSARCSRLSCLSDFLARLAVPPL
jgi:hypothetical protein